MHTFVLQDIQPGFGEGDIHMGPVVFVGSYIVVVNWTLLQICVAVLLDSFLSTRRQFEEEAELKQLEAAAARGTIRSTLDPLLEGLARDYSDDADLSCRLRDLFKVLNAIQPERVVAKNECGLSNACEQVLDVEGFKKMDGIQFRLRVRQLVSRIMMFHID
jgi:hypothetical protein